MNNCPKCQSKDLQKFGHSRGKQKLQCKVCNFIFLAEMKEIKCPICKKSFYPFNHRKCCSIECKKEFSKNTLKDWRFKNRKNRHDSDQETRQEILKILGDKCSNPFGINHEPFEKIPEYFSILQIDHVNGGGCKEHRKHSGLSFHRHVLKQVKAGSKDYQLLCPTCNWLKRKVNKEEKQSIIPVTGGFK